MDTALFAPAQSLTNHTTTNHVLAHDLWTTLEVTPPAAATSFVVAQHTHDVPLAGAGRQPIQYERLQRVILTDAVARTLFGDFADHRQGTRGTEEIGWLLLGIRETNQALVLATLPAGSQRDAGVAHVQFNSNAQALASRIIRQWDKRLVILGVAHTHPGSLRHPSEGDYHGDSRWVGQLRGQEGIFAIGTADEPASAGVQFAQQPEPYRQCLGELCWSWYSLGVHDPRYRPLEVSLTLGPDLARPLQPLWSVLEQHATALERLVRQQQHVSFDVVRDAETPTLLVQLTLAEPNAKLRLHLQEDAVRYYWGRNDAWSEIDSNTRSLERAVYLILAELAEQL